MTENNSKLYFSPKTTLISILFLLVVLSTGCGSSSNDSDEQYSDLPVIDTNQPPVATGNWYRPAPSTSWQWQLQNSESLNTTYSADIYDIDLFDVPENLIQQLKQDGRKVICYFSAGSYESFREDATDFAEEDLGKTLDGWPDEKWLDIRSTNARKIMQERLDLAVSKGCDGVEPDNMDGYSNDSGFSLQASDQLTYNRFIANEAHSRGLSVALKNTLDLIPQLVEYFDFSVNEQCFEFNECDSLKPFIDSGKAVLNAEYLNRYINDSAQRASLCDQALALSFSTLVLPQDVDDSFRYSCI